MVTIFTLDMSDNIEWKGAPKEVVQGLPENIFTNRELLNTTFILIRNHPPEE